MRFLKWLPTLILGLSMPISVSAAPSWSPDPGGTELIGNTTVTLDGNLTLDKTYTGSYNMSFNLAGNTSAATVEVKNVQTFTGGVNVGNGVTLKLNQTEGNRGTGYGAIRGTITLNEGGKIDIATGSQTGYGANATKWALNGGQLINSTSDKIATMNLIDVRGDVTISGNSTHDLGTFALDNKFSVHSGNVTINTNKIALASRYGETKYQQDFYINDGSLVTINGELADIPSTAADGWEGGNARSLRKTGGGTLLINTVTSYTGSTIAYRGTLKIGVDNPFPTSKFEMSDKAVGILDLNGHKATLNLASNIYGTIMNSVADTTSVATLNIAEGEAYEVSGVIKNGTGKTAVIVTGGGTLNVAKAQTFSGGLTIENGTVTLSGSGDGVNDFTKYGVIRNTITVEKDGVLEFLSGSAMGYGRDGVQGAPILTVNGGKVDNTKSPTHNLLYNVTMSNGGKIIDNTTGRTGWAGNYGLDGDFTVTAGTDNIISAEKLVMSARYTANPNKSNTFNVAKDAELTLDGNLLNPWTTIDTGARSLVKTGAGTLTLTGENNTYKGVTTVSAGTLEIDGTDNSATTIKYATSAVNVAGGTDNAKLVISGNENQSIIIPKVNVNNHGEIEFTSAGKKLTVDTDITVANGGLMRLTVPADLTAGLLIDGKLELESFDSLLIDISQIALDEEYELLTATGGIFVGDKAITDTLDFEQFLKDDTGVLNTFSVVSLANGGFGLAMNAGSGVPEPATWVLMILGGLGIFHISRNSQKKGAFQK